jgi:predicted transcriptional regulator
LEVSADGTFVDGMKISTVKLEDLNIRAHTSVKVRIGIKEQAAIFEESTFSVRDSVITIRIFC